MNTHGPFPLITDHCLLITSPKRTALRLTGPNLARPMRVSKRTIYRDIRLLQDVGLDIFLDPTNRAYALRSRFPKPIRNWLRAGITAGVSSFGKLARRLHGQMGP